MCVVVTPSNSTVRDAVIEALDSRLGLYVPKNSTNFLIAIAGILRLWAMRNGLFDQEITHLFCNFHLRIYHFDVHCCCALTSPP